MGIITTQLDLLYSTKAQADRVIEAKAIMQGAFDTIAEANARVQAIVDLGTLNAVPAETKAALNKAWTALKTCEASLKDVGVQEAINWTGKG